MVCAPAPAGHSHQNGKEEDHGCDHNYIHFITNKLRADATPLCNTITAGIISDSIRFPSMT